MCPLPHRYTLSAPPLTLLDLVCTLGLLLALPKHLHVIAEPNPLSAPHSCLSLAFPPSSLSLLLFRLLLFFLFFVFFLVRLVL